MVFFLSYFFDLLEDVVPRLQRTRCFETIVESYMKNQNDEVIQTSGTEIICVFAETNRISLSIPSIPS